MFHVEPGTAVPPTSSVPDGPAPTPDEAAALFGAGLDEAERFAALLADAGVERGVIGPREADRLWERHLLNSAVLGELLPAGSSVLDVGSGAGLPGVALALARPDLRVALLEPMARRIGWLTEVVAALGLDVDVHRGRAEDGAVRRALGEWDVVTARAVAPLGRLAGWCLPLVRPGGRLLAVKGAAAAAEAERDAVVVRAAGGGDIEVVQCGVGALATPTTVVAVTRRRAGTRAGARRRKDR